MSSEDRPAPWRAEVLSPPMGAADAKAPDMDAQNSGAASWMPWTPRARRPDPLPLRVVEDQNSCVFGERHMGHT